MKDQLATAAEVAAAIPGATVGSLAQLRYRGTGPKFIKAGRKVLYRWSDVESWLDDNTRTITGDAA